MIYAKVLYYIGFLPWWIQTLILVATAILSIYGICHLPQNVLRAFNPIALILAMQVVKKTAFFITGINVTNMNKLLYVILLVILFIFVAKKFGPFGVVVLIFSIINGFLVYKIIGIQSTTFFKTVSIVAFIVVMLIAKKWFNMSKLEFIILFGIGAILSFVIGAYLAIEIMLLIESLIIAIKEIGISGIFCWLLLIVAGLLASYLIELVFAHVLLFIVLFLIIRFILNTI